MKNIFKWFKNKCAKQPENEELIWLGQGWQLVKKPIDEEEVKKLFKELEELIEENNDMRRYL